MERHSFGNLSLFLLLAVVLQLNRLVLASSSPINCTLRIDGQTPVTEGQVINLRRGEDLIVNCKGDPGIHSDLTFDCDGPHKALKKNRTTLEYTWYCHIENDGIVSVHGFDNNAFLLIAFTVKAHDLDALVSASSVGGGGSSDANQQNRSSTDEENTNTESDTTTSATAVKVTRFYVAVAVAAILLLIVAVLLLALVVMAICLCTRNKVGNEEEGENELDLGPIVRVVDETPPPPQNGGGQGVDDTDAATSDLDISSAPLKADGQ